MTYTMWSGTLNLTQLNSGQDCWQATRLLKFDILSKVCCLNLFTLNVYANYVVVTSVH